MCFVYVEYNNFNQKKCNNMAMQTQTQTNLSLSLFGLGFKVVKAFRFGPK